MRKVGIGLAVVLVIAIALYFRFRQPSGPTETAYAGNREVTIWSTTAQVREPVATAKYGEKLLVLNRSQDQVQVKTTGGAVGWISESDLLSADLWQRAADLESTAGKSPIEAEGHTHAISNLHVEAGRESPRVRQLNKSVPLDVYMRKVVDVPVAPSAMAAAATVPAADRDSNGASQGSVADTTAATPAPATKKEDWWLVRAHLADQTTVSGWILGRFIDLDVPAPLPDYASAAGMRSVAWFQLDKVADASGGAKAQYLLVGDKGPEGQPCDFTQMRVFTWGAQKQRYETAYVESDVCGKLPVKITPAAKPGGDVLFAFQDLSDGAQRTYRMERTIVRRVRENGSKPAKRKHAHG
jgi:hypothetical protein